MVKRVSAKKAATKAKAATKVPTSNKAAAKAESATPREVSPIRTQQYRVPDEVRTPREGSIIEAIYKLVNARRKTAKVPAKVATGQMIIEGTANSDTVVKPKNGSQFSESEILQTIRYLVKHERLEEVG